MVAFSCQQQNKSKYTYIPYVDTTIIDNIFLDFRFGMTESEFLKHIKKLTAQKTLIHESDRYYFPMAFDESGLTKGNAYILNPNYHLGKLYEFNVRLAPSDDLFSNKTMVKAELMVLLMRKYDSAPDDRSQLYGTRPDFVIEKGNLKVLGIEGVDHVLLIYTDKRVSEILDAEKENKSKKEFKKSVDAI